MNITKEDVIVISLKKSHLSLISKSSVECSLFPKALPKSPATNESITVG